MRELLLYPAQSIGFVKSKNVESSCFTLLSYKYRGDYVVPDGDSDFVYFGNREVFIQESGVALVDPRPFILFIKYVFECYLDKKKMECSGADRLYRFLLRLNTHVGLFSNPSFFDKALLTAKQYSPPVSAWEKEVWGGSHFTWYRGMIIGVKNKKIELKFEYLEDGVSMTWNYLDDMYNGHFWKKIFPWPKDDENGNLYVL